LASGVLDVGAHPGAGLVRRHERRAGAHDAPLDHRCRYARHQRARLRRRLVIAGDVAAGTLKCPASIAPRRTRRARRRRWRRRTPGNVQCARGRRPGSRAGVVTDEEGGVEPVADALHHAAGRRRAGHEVTPAGIAPGRGCRRRWCASQTTISRRRRRDSRRAPPAGRPTWRRGRGCTRAPPGRCPFRGRRRRRPRDRLR